jgi:hypothetical protein
MSNIDTEVDEDKKRKRIVFSATDKHHFDSLINTFGAFPLRTRKSAATMEEQRHQYVLVEFGKLFPDRTSVCTRKNVGFVAINGPTAAKSPRLRVYSEADSEGGCNITVHGTHQTTRETIQERKSEDLELVERGETLIRESVLLTELESASSSRPIFTDYESAKIAFAPVQELLQALKIRMAVPECKRMYLVPQPGLTACVKLFGTTAPLSHG